MLRQSLARATPQTPKNLLMKFDAFVLRLLNCQWNFNLPFALKLACLALVKT